MGFIEDFVEFCLEELPNSDHRWLEELAMASIASAVGTRFQVPSLGGLCLNIYVLAIGPSRLGVKTLPFKYIKPMLEPLERVMPDEFTEEGLMTYLSENKFSEGLILKDEATALFNQPKYNKNLLEFLSKLYSGQSMSKKIASRDYERIEESSISLLAATTESLYKFMKPENFIQGFGNRILWNKLNTKHIPLDEEEYFNDPAFIAKQNVKLQQTFVHWLEKLIPEKKTILSKSKLLSNTLGFNGKSDIIYLKIDKQASKLLTEFRNETNKRGTEIYNENSSNLISSYYGSCGEFANKLAGIKAVSDMYPETDWHNITITYEVAQWAVDRVLDYVETFEIILDEWRTKPIDMEVQSDEPYLILVRNKIKETCDEMGFFHTTVVSSQLPFSADKYVKYRDSLIQRGEVIQLDKSLLPREITTELAKSKLSFKRVLYAYTPKLVKFYEKEIGKILTKEEEEEVNKLDSHVVDLLKQEKLSNLLSH